MDPHQQFCLKWNSYSSNLALTFSNYFKSESLADVTLFCGGTIFKAHRLILAACSKHFADLFQTAPINGSCCVILEATSAENMSALLEFMYKGEVHVSQESLNSFLKAAESLQVKGLSTEHGRLAAAPSSGVHDVPLESPTGSSSRRQGRGSLSGSGNLGHTGIKQECDSLMHPSSAGLAGFHSYISPMYRPLPYDPPRKRPLRSPYIEQEARGSVLRDGSKGSAGNASPISKGYRPGSSASSSAPTEADALQTERTSPQQSRYENHSPPSTTAGNGNTPTAIADRSERSERNGGNATDPIDDDKDERDSNDAGAEDLRVKNEIDYSPPPPTLSTNAPPTPTTPVTFVSAKGTTETIDGGLPGGLASQIATADMLNVWTASKLANKGGSVNTADGKKLKCPFCERLYGYETNLRAHIRQRHQGIRVPCPYCTRTFTRNNTVRRHIAREHKHEQYNINSIKYDQHQMSQLQSHTQ
ncbi:zinc finger protein chinmo isoform X2 [Lutzomyia longipalpis]|uniref:zinc finger protein chinmo isoform X2 n=1 Tax=Lutzomyia longipalpis TaxID=7200 RepID=UPI00248418D6|nr:zinc finger protein chinmo isoform X2 [Lutzomyia longipalpis]